MDTYITEKEASTLQEYFSLGYAYESRYKHALIIYGNIVTYNDTRYGNSKETYEMSYLRLMYSLTRLTRRNVHIRKGFSARKLDYDSKMVTITDKGQAFAVTFSHAMIKLINYCVNLLEFGSYEELVSVSMNPKNTLLIENLAAVEYIASSMLKPMRNYQDKYSEVLRHEIEVVSTQGEKSLYILIGSCAAAALVSIGLVFPVFIWIIKDKSCVIAIFADITEEEIKAITENIENFDIRNVVVKNRWVRACDGNEDKFWKKVIKCQGKDNDKENPSNKPKTPEASSPSAIVGSEKPLAKNVPKVIDKQEDNKENAELDLAKIDLKDIAELEATKKRMARRDHLSKLDSKLRNTAILRLSIVLCVFLIYGGTSSYLNYYFHRINKSTTSHLYVLLKRSIYLPTMTAMISRSVLSGDKTFVVDPSIIFCKIRIVDYPSVLDGNDIIRKMQVIESEIKRYERDGNRGIFKEYFKWSHLLDTDEFCSIVDAQRTPQSESMTYGGDFIVECANLYSGPAGHGLSGGIGYLISFFDIFSVKIMDTDFGDETQATKLKNDPTFLNFQYTFSQYLYPALDFISDLYAEEAINFFGFIKKIAVIKAAVFGVLFTVVYLFVFIYFLNMLKLEIWQTHAIINMIPDEIVEKNKAVQEQIWKRRDIK